MLEIICVHTIDLEIVIERAASIHAGPGGDLSAAASAELGRIRDVGRNAWRQGEDLREIPAHQREIRDHRFADNASEGTGFLLNHDRRRFHGNGFRQRSDFKLDVETSCFGNRDANAGTSRGFESGHHGLQVIGTRSELGKRKDAVFI